MPSPLRFIPEDAKLWTDSKGRRIAVAEITIRCHQGRSLLKPTQHNTSLILGVLGRAQERLDFELYGYAYLSTHGSILVGVRDAEHQARIMEYIHGNIAAELGRPEYSDWPEKFWGRRGRPILVLSNHDLEERLRYLLANSTKEHLVRHPTRWPGAHCARALCYGTTDKGLWIDHTELSRLERKNKTDKRVSEVTVVTHYDVKLYKLPCCAHMTDEEYRQYNKDNCCDIAENAAEEREETGASVLGVSKIMRRHPHYRPDHLDKSPAPPIHCCDDEQRSRFLEAYRAFVAAYREAFAALRDGIAEFGFPDGGIPPGYRFFPATAPDTG
jgi:hypothetical protein